MTRTPEEGLDGADWDRSERRVTSARQSKWCSWDEGRHLRGTEEPGREREDTGMGRGGMGMLGRGRGGARGADLGVARAVRGPVIEEDTVKWLMGAFAWISIGIGW